MNMKRMLLIVLTCVGLITPLVSYAQTSNPWEDNLNVLVTELPKRHISPFTHLSETAFRAAADQLRADLPHLTDSQRLVRMAALVASLGDAHTTLNWPDQGVFPVGLQFFAEGLYCVAAYPEAADALGARLVSINNHPINEVIVQVQTIIAHENESWLKAQLPNFIIRPEVLSGLGLIPGDEAVTWEFETLTGSTVEVKIAPGKLNAAKIRPARAANRFPRTESTNGNYWLQTFSDGTLYFKYNSAVEVRDLPFSRFTEILLNALPDLSVKRLVIDFRDNTGGDSRLLEPLIAALKTQPINVSGKLFVITGVRTFSSAVLNVMALRQSTHAVLIGQPTGGSPNHFGEVQQLALPAFDLKLLYSTKYFETMPGTTATTITPDVLIDRSVKDYLAGIDSFYAAVLAYKGL